MARRIQGRDTTAESEVRFLTTYGDAVTLLMAFFVMMYTISQVDAHKFQLLVSGLEDPFKNEAISEGLLESGPGLVGPGAELAADSAPPPGLELMPGAAAGEDPPDPVAGGDRDGDRDAGVAESTVGSVEGGGPRLLTTVEELDEIRRLLDSRLRELSLDVGVSARLDPRGLVVSIATDDVLFASGSPELSTAGRTVIAAMAPILGRFDNDILIEGHTDTVPLDDAGYTNWNLSADRALSVLEMLESSDVSPVRLSATGFGEHRPVGDNTTEEGRAANRRVELVIVTTEPDDRTED